MHNKVILIDDRSLITGSYNFSENAEANDENLLLIESPEIWQAYSDYFDALFALPANRSPIGKPDLTL